MASVDCPTTLVIDAGSDGLRAGPSTYTEAPPLDIKTYCGILYSAGIFVGHVARPFFVGDKGYLTRFIMKQKFPVERGRVRVSEINYLRNCWKYVRDKFQFPESSDDDFPKEREATPKAFENFGLLLTESSKNTLEAREAMLSAAFEEVGAESLIIANRSLCSIFGHGADSGFCLHVGHGLSSCVPVIEGSVVRDSVRTMDYAGDDLVADMAEIYRSEEYGFENPTEFVFLREIKETLCYVARDVEEELITFEATSHCLTSYELPDGAKLPVGRHRFLASECLFDPARRSPERTPTRRQRQYLDTTITLPCDMSLSLQQMVASSIQSCESSEALNLPLFACGGTTRLEGFSERLTSELNQLLGWNVPVKYQGKPKAERCIGAYLGGTVIASVGSLNQQRILRSEFEESGPSSIHRKCQWAVDDSSV